MIPAVHYLKARNECAGSHNPVIVMADDRPRVRCLVSLEICPGVFTDSAECSLELAAELRGKGYAVLVDPADERDLASWERFQRSLRTQSKKWFRGE